MTTQERVLFAAFTGSDATLDRPSLQALGAAAALSESLGTPLAAGLVGGDVEPAASAIAGACTRIVGVRGAAFGHSRYATDALAMEVIARHVGATIVIAPGTPRAQRCLPGVAARLRGAADTHVTWVALANGGPSVKRWFYRQRIEATLGRTRRPWIILIEPGSFPDWIASAGGTTALEMLDVPTSDPVLRTTVRGVEAPSVSQQTIRPDAKLLLVAGAGWTKKQADGQVHAAEAGTLILEFLERTQASLGGSKSLVDLSGEGQQVLPFMTHLNQVGQTGSTPRHPKGLSTCCHGEEPHVVGWRFVTERRAVNLNPNCGWAQGKTDVLYVADAFAVLARVNELLAPSGSSPQSVS
jgi:electron transfer flavoprotein alpha subunit